MPTEPKADPPRWPVLVLRRTEQAAAAALLALALAAMAGHWAWQGRFRGRLIEIDQAEPVAIEFKIDINQADWPELCLMPGVGEQLAKRIVEYREEHGPFRDFQDLKEVRGIGPKTFDGMTPFLVPLPDLETTAGENAGSADNGAIN